MKERIKPVIQPSQYGLGSRHIRKPTYGLSGVIQVEDYGDPYTIAQKEYAKLHGDMFNGMSHSVFENDLTSKEFLEIFLRLLLKVGYISHGTNRKVGKVYNRNRHDESREVVFFKSKDKDSICYLHTSKIPTGRAIRIYLQRDKKYSQNKDETHLCWRDYSNKIISENVISPDRGARFLEEVFNDIDPEDGLRR